MANRFGPLDSFPDRGFDPPDFWAGEMSDREALCEKADNLVAEILGLDGVSHVDADYSQKKVIMLRVVPQVPGFSLLIRVADRADKTARYDYSVDDSEGTHAGAIEFIVAEIEKGGVK